MLKWIHKMFKKNTVCSGLSWYINRSCENRTFLALDTPSPHRIPQGYWKCWLLLPEAQSWTPYVKYMPLTVGYLLSFLGKSGELKKRSNQFPTKHCFLFDQELIAATKMITNNDLTICRAQTNSPLALGCKTRLPHPGYSREGESHEKGALEITRLGHYSGGKVQ